MRRTRLRTLLRGGVVASVLVATLAAAGPAAAWSRWFKVNDARWTSDWADNDMTATSGPYYHALYASEDLSGSWTVYSRFNRDVGSVDRRLITSYDCDLPQGIAADGDLVVSACSDRQFAGELRVFRSPDAGATWAGPVIVASGVKQDDGASIAVSGQVVLVAWTDTAGRIKVRRSVDGGVSFAAAEQIGTTASKYGGKRTGRVKIDAQGQAVYVVWTTGNTTRPIYATVGLAIRRSTDLGVSWKPTRTLTTGKILDTGAALVATDAGALVAWSTATGRLELARSSDGGSTFKTRSLTGADVSWDLVDVAATGESARVTYGIDGPHYSILVRIKRSDDGGRTWSGAQSTGIAYGPDSSPWANVSLLGASPIVTASGNDGNDQNWWGVSLYASHP